MFSKSVDEILRTFDKARKDLETLALNRARENERLYEKVNSLQSRINSNSSEKERATRVIARIDKLIA